ncbi:MAG: FmdB family transcriptional regulator [Thermodesulfobacterium geofontis]|uniref:FmdB family transcriptional regulator n=1 Tax=Thermodesulfobacterium geofontis TaxID=1295609 RepID=A0A2N7PPT3_9BACT|nr:MAG: FmdB family transcriptional regulator [Thermodesulfobacterium geofontis]
MPLYEYKCLDCGKISEFLINLNLKEKVICKYCGSKNVEKVFSPIIVLNSEASINQKKGLTCCGREERCNTPSCSEGKECRKY